MSSRDSGMEIFGFLYYWIFGFFESSFLIRDRALEEDSMYCGRNSCSRVAARSISMCILAAALKRGS